MRQAAALGLACALVAGPAHARPFTVEDLLSLQDLGRTAFSPDGRWLVMDVEAPWKTAARFDLDARTPLALGRPMIVDVAGGGPARPLLAFEPGAGYTTGAFSPDGGRVVVFRLKDHRLDLGVTALATGETVWTGLGVDAEVFAAVARWSGPDRLVVLARESRDTRALPRGWIHQERSAGAWSAAAAGEPSATSLGSGRYRSAMPPPPLARLVTVDPRTGAAHTLAQGAFIDMTLSPDGRRVAVIEEAGSVPPGLEPPSAFKPSVRRRLVLADLASGRLARPCGDCDLATLPLAWSPDGTRVLAAARRDAGPPAFGYWSLAMDGLAAALAPDLAAPQSPGRDPRVIGGAAWLDGVPTVLAQPAAGGRADWWRLEERGAVRLTAGLPAAPGPAIAAGPSALLLATASGPVRLTARGRIEALAPMDARLGLPASLPGERPTAAVAMTAGTARRIWPRPGASWSSPAADGARLLDVLPARRLTARLLRDAHGVATVLVQADDGPGRPVLTLNAGLASVEAAAPIAVPHRDPAGQPRTSWLYLPPGVPAADTPVIVVPYPGAAYPAAPAEGEPGVLAFTANIQVLTGAGYAVLVPSLPSRPGAEPGEGLAAAILAAVDAARLRHPELSASRLAIWGQSFGGWGALMAAVQSDRFKAVIATSPITDLLSYYGKLGPQALAAPDRYVALPTLFGWSETGQGQMQGPPWTDPARYLRASPGLQTDRISAPVMLVTSDSDFTSGQSEPVFSALYRQGKDALLVSYRGEGHVILSPGNVRDLYARAFSFLAGALGPPAAAPDRPSQ